MTKKKKILIIVLSIVAVLAIGIGITVGVLLRPKKAPAPGAGVIYQTKEVKIWSGYSGAYMDFEYIEEPADGEKEEGKRYGYVFNVKFYNEGSWQAWLSGSWEMNESKTELTLLSDWGSGENDTKLADATSGKPKTYTAESGKFTIGVIVPSDGKVNFTLDTVADKVGEGGIPTPPCTEHVDTNPADGKCDKCGEDMPAVDTRELMVTLDAHDDATTADVHIKMYSDKSFDFILDLMSMGKVLGGTWASTDSTGQNPMADIRLTVDPASLPAGMESPIGDTVDVKITALNEQYTAFKYTCAVVYNVPNQITMNLKFVGGYPSGTEVPHVDADSDNKCDDCGANMPVVGECEHVDANHDGICDKNCGKTDIAVTHTDANHDGVCDAEKCNTAMDYAHKDINADDKCDVCEQTMTTERKYTSDTVKIWSDTQSATLVLNAVTAPDSKPATDKTVYGNVFYLTVGTMGEFLSGTWSIEDNTLMLTANWGDGTNETKLTDATSGVAKSYALSSGKYSVAVDLPSAANTVFTINVGESVTDPCTEHVDTNPVDGKCDKCGEDMSAQSEKTLLVTLNATDTKTTMAAEIKMYADNTFDFVLPSMGGRVFGGTWASSDSTNPVADIILTYDATGGSPVVGATDTMTITPSQDYSSMTYTCHVDYVVPQTITMSFDFTGTLNLA